MVARTGNLYYGFLTFLMKIQENAVEYDDKYACEFREAFDHPDYLKLTEDERQRVASRWVRQLYDLEVERPTFDRYFGDLTKYCSGGVMLDIGCYIGGRSLRWLERYRGRELYGIDLDERFILAGNRYAAQNNLPAKFLVNNAEAMEFPDQYFDVIITQNSLEHVASINSVMKEVYRVLRPNGYLACVFPSFWCPFDHHLDLVTKTPFIHWFFRYSDILRCYFSILDERGESSRWYRRAQEYPLPFERGYSINGTTARDFRFLIRENWEVVVDGFLETRHTNSLKRLIMTAITHVPVDIVREVFPVSYILRKRS